MKVDFTRPASTISLALLLLMLNCRPNSATDTNKTSMPAPLPPDASAH